jgi:hypothetical protein
MPVRTPARPEPRSHKTGTVGSGAQSALVGPALRRLRAFAGIRQKSAMTTFLSAGPCTTVVISRSDRPFGTARQDGNARVVAQKRPNAKACASGLRRTSDFATGGDTTPSSRLRRFDARRCNRTGFGTVVYISLPEYCQTRIIYRLCCSFSAIRTCHIARCGI